MARRVPVDDKPRPIRANPVDILGEDVVKVGAMAVGLAATAMVNDSFVHPAVSKFVPAGSQATSKLVDAATTAGTAWAIGEGVGMVDRSIGRDMKTGGLILAAGKVISVPFSGFSISGQLNLAGFPGAQAPAANQIQAANGKVISLASAKAANGAAVQVLTSSVPAAEYVGL